MAKAIDVAGLTADLRRERAMSIISESGVAVEKKAEEPAKTGGRRPRQEEARREEGRQDRRDRGRGSAQGQEDHPQES